MSWKTISNGNDGCRKKTQLDVEWCFLTAVGEWNDGADEKIKATFNALVSMQLNQSKAFQQRILFSNEWFDESHHLREKWKNKCNAKEMDWFS